MKVDSYIETLKLKIDEFILGRNSFDCLYKDVFPIVMNHKIPENYDFYHIEYSSEERDLIINEITDYYLDGLTSKNLIDLIDNNFFLEFCKYHVPKDYINNPMFDQSFDLFIESNIIEDDCEELLLGKNKSITKLLGNEYPYDTCPMIDSDKNIIEDLINDLKNKLIEIDDEDEISSIEEEIDTAVDELSKAEELREACEKMRSLAQEFTTQFREETKVFKINDETIIEFPNFISSYFEDKKDNIDSPFFKSFSNGLMSDSIANYENLSELVTFLINSYENFEIQGIIKENTGIEELKEYKNRIKEDLLNPYSFKVF